MTTTLEDVLRIAELPSDASDVEEDPVAEVRRIRQILQLYINDNLDDESKYLQSPERVVKVITNDYWKQKGSPLVDAMNLLKKLRPRKARLFYIFQTIKTNEQHQVHHISLQCCWLKVGRLAFLPGTQRVSGCKITLLTTLDL